MTEKYWFVFQVQVMYLPLLSHKQGVHAHKSVGMSTTPFELTHVETVVTWSVFGNQTDKARVTLIIQ